MSDIFISYAREDRDAAQRLAEVLEVQGWSAWWDTRLRAGEVWDGVVERELATARCVVVLWSKASVQSYGVREEARKGLERRILVPVRIEHVEPPLAFPLIHAGDLIDWKGQPGHPGIRKVVADVAGTMGPPPSLLPSPYGNGEDSTNFLKSPWPRWLEHSVARCLLKREVAVKGSHGDSEFSRCRTWFASLRRIKPHYAILVLLAALAPERLKL